MAKLNNVGIQQHQEAYPLVAAAAYFLGSVGVLAGLIVTVVGIKLWWFKHRLNFEQTSLQNGAAGGQTPNVVVTRREKKPKFSKDKRWSQQIYQSVDVHGVFKQKTEDDMEIQRPQQLPPVRIRHAESAPSLILPPPRYKRSQEKLQSKAFEESGEIYETIIPPSNHSQEISSRPTSLVFNEADTRISLTFEEFENQLKLPEEELATQDIGTVEIPQPPKRPNRSNSTLPKTVGLEEKPHRFLKSSQSIAVPEYRKVVDRRPTGFQRPTEDDLTKIDNFEEPRFEKFGDRRPTGYIKYEEVDFHLSEMRNNYQHDEGNSMYDSGYLDNHSNDTAIEALRNENIVYQNNAKESLEFNNPNIYNSSYGEPPLYANQKELALDGNDLSTTSSFEYSSIQKDNEFINVDENETKFGNPNCDSEIHLKTQETCDDLSPLDPMDFKRKEVPSLSPGNMEPQAFAFCDEMEQDLYSEPQSESSIFLKCRKNSEFERDYFANPDTAKPNEPVDYETINITRHTKAGSNEIHEEHESKTVSFYGQTIETVNFEKLSSIQTSPTEFVRERQTSEYCEISEDSESQIINEKAALEMQGVDRRIQPHVDFLLNENINNSYDAEEKFTLNQRRPTEFTKFTQVEEDEQAKPLQQSVVTFDEDLTFTDGDEEKFTLNQRRPTEFSRFKFEKEVNEDEHELPEKQTVRFELNTMEDNEDKFTLNQRRPTGFFPTNDIKEDLYEEIRVQEVKFEELYEEIQTTPVTPRGPEDFNENQRTENKTVNLLENDTTDRTLEPKAEPDRPIAFVRRTKSENSDKASTNSVWQELERDIQLDITQNIEEEFNKIRHSFEMNEADFLEIKGELQLNSPMSDTLPSNTLIESSSSAFGKSIEDDWENFEKLKSDTTENRYEIVQDHKEIHITYNNDVGNNKEKELSTVSILKESKLEQILHETSKLEAKPRKSKVTFDFKTEEHVIPARRSASDEDTEDDDDDDVDVYWDDQDYDENVYNKPPPPIPTQRSTKPKFTEEHAFSPVLTTPSAISLFGSQISQDDSGETEDSWSAIKKHRHLTSQFQNLSLDSPTSPPPPSFPPPPLPTTRNLYSTKDRAPRPAFRNPMAQLAVQRAKEVRTEMGGFKSRSIKDSKQAQSKRTSQEFLQLKNDFDDTEA